MITKEKLGINLDILRNIIPKKPAIYTPNHPVNLKEALTLYSNSSSVNSIQTCTIGLNEHNWPLILWVNPNNIKFGFFNRLYYRRFYNSWKFKRGKFKGLKDFDYLWISIMFFKT